MKLSRYEQETIINYNMEEKVASCFTHDPALIRRLDAMCASSPEITLIREGEGWREYLFPKKWVKVKMPRQYSDEKRAEFAERMRALREEQKCR